MLGRFVNREPEDPDLLGGLGQVPKELVLYSWNRISKMHNFAFKIHVFAKFSLNFSLKCLIDAWKVVILGFLSNFLQQIVTENTSDANCLEFCPL